MMITLTREEADNMGKGLKDSVSRILGTTHSLEQVTPSSSSFLATLCINKIFIFLVQFTLLNTEQEPSLSFTIIHYWIGKHPHL